MLAPGTQMGNFRVLDQIGEGGMGVVFRAKHVEMELYAAIKVLSNEAARSEEVVKRFVNEARAAASLKHRNVVQVYDVGKTSDGRWYVTLELLDGGPLSRFMRSYGPMEPSQIVQLLCQACNGLHVAHDAGIIHRDVKPDNLFLTETPLARPGSMDKHVTVIDFGIAKLRAEVAELQTRSHMVMGTPPYMSPEQLRESKDVDRRSDVYALGVIAYEMTSGIRPWGEESSLLGVHDLARYHPELRDPRNAPLPPGAVKPAIPEEWAQVIIRALAFERGERWPTARDFVLALATAVPRTDWSEDGMEIVRRFTPELTVLPMDGETAGKVAPSLGGTPPPSPAAALVTQPARPSGLAVDQRRPGAATVRLPETSPPSLVAAQSVGPSTAALRRSPRALLIAAAVGGVALVAVVLVVALGGGGGSTATRKPAAASMPDSGAALVAPTAAVAILTEPDGAQITVDGTPRGTAPLNLALPVGADVVVQAEMAGFTTATQTIHVGTVPTTLRLRLAAIAMDAGVADAAPAVTVVPPDPSDHGRGRRRTKPPGRGSGSGTAAAGSGSGSTSRPFNPDDVPD